MAEISAKLNALVDQKFAAMERKHAAELSALAKGIGAEVGTLKRNITSQQKQVETAIADASAAYTGTSQDRPKTMVELDQMATQHRKDMAR